MRGVMLKMMNLLTMLSSQQNLPLDQPAVNHPNNQSLKPEAVPIGKLNLLMVMVALQIAIIALFIGILLGGGVF